MNTEDVVIAKHVSALGVQDVYNDFWTSSEPQHITRYWSGKVAPVERHAEVRLCWSEEALLARFLCNQHEALIVSANPTTTAKTLGLWDRDVCELYLAPDCTNPNRYFEFEVAPTGEWLDLAIQMGVNGKQTDWEFSSGMSVSAQMEDQKLIVSMSIPWSGSIPKPTAGDAWRVNFFRCVGPEESSRYLAWRPTFTRQPNFHVPVAFGWLRFAA
ncbi:MAG: carbohydrate-binding family 9-like protein [Pyrinomonadaceae bacterium]